eukprot:SAG25_NODE_1722_length_2448_cov_97.187279_4_plen_183_part_00
MPVPAPVCARGAQQAGELVLHMARGGGGGGGGSGGAGVELVLPTTSEGVAIRIGRSAGVAGAVNESGEALLINRPYEDARFDQATDRATGFTTTSILCVREIDYRETADCLPRAAGGGIDYRPRRTLVHLRPRRVTMPRELSASPVGAWRADPPPLHTHTHAHTHAPNGAPPQLTFSTDILN